jgi:hypothetical protein
MPARISLLSSRNKNDDYNYTVCLNLLQKLQSSEGAAENSPEFFTTAQNAGRSRFLELD